MQNLLIQYSTIASRNNDPFRWQAAGMGYAVRSGKGRFLYMTAASPRMQSR